MAIRQPRSGIRAPKRPKWQSPYHGVRMSEEQYLSLPEEKPYLEYVGGMVLQKPMPNDEHSVLGAELALVLGLYSRANGGKAAVEGRVRMGELPNLRLPDVSFFGASATRGDDAVPTLTIEIRSPDQSVPELRQKCRQFRRAGAQAAWLIDPRSRTVEVFEGDRDGVVIRDDGVLTAGALPGFELRVAEPFAVLNRQS